MDHADTPLSAGEARAMMKPGRAAHANDKGGGPPSVSSSGNTVPAGNSLGDRPWGPSAYGGKDPAATPGAAVRAHHFIAAPGKYRWRAISRHWVILKSAKAVSRGPFFLPLWGRIHA